MLPKPIWQEIEAVFFDAEGTLVHITPSVGHIYAKIWERYGLLADPEEINQIFYQIFRATRGRWDSDPESCFEGWKEVFLKTASHFGSLKKPEEAYRECYECFAKKEFFTLAPDTFITLEKLKRSGIRLAVISNWDERLKRLLKALDLLPFFEAIFIACELGLAKPDPAIYEHACQQLKVPPKRALMVGDSLEDDVLAARKAGLWALRYPGGSLLRLFPT